MKKFFKEVEKQMTREQIILTIILIGFLLILVGEIGQFVYQLNEYGRYVGIMLVNHWSLWFILIGAGIDVITYIIYKIFLK